MKPTYLVLIRGVYLKLSTTRISRSTEIKMSSEILEKHSLAQLLATDEITLTILPQKKGFFRKHVEYEIKSSKHKSQVCVYHCINLKLNTYIYITLKKYITYDIYYRWSVGILISWHFLKC